MIYIFRLKDHLKCLTRRIVRCQWRNAILLCMLREIADRMMMSRKVEIVEQGSWELQFYSPLFTAKTSKVGPNWSNVSVSLGQQKLSWTGYSRISLSQTFCSCSLWNGVWSPTFFWVNHESITILSGCLKLIDTLRVNHWGEIGRSQLVYKFQPGQYVNGLWTMDWEAAGLAKRTLLTNEQRECQLAWALAYKNWTWYQWQRVLFSEESKFDVGNHSRNSFVRRRPGEE